MSLQISRWLKIFSEISVLDDHRAGFLGVDFLTILVLSHSPIAISVKLKYIIGVQGKLIYFCKEELWKLQ